MASWMVHLRIADALIDKIPGLDETAFVVGNIAPDSGVPNEDWTVFSPPKSVSHYLTAEPGGGAKQICMDAFRAEYFSPEHIRTYSKAAYAFFLGYYIHLLTDVEWSDKISEPTVKQHALESSADRRAFIEQMKEDWYDLDFRYLHEHPDFRAFQIYAQAEGFRNEYMHQFSPDAFDNRREYICGFYRSEEHGLLYRDYPYLNPAQQDRFVEETVQAVLRDLGTP